MLVDVTGRQLAVMWWVNVVAVVVCGIAVVAAAVLPEEDRFWLVLPALGLIVSGFIVMWRCRPRPLDVGWVSPRASKDLEALNTGERIETEVRREFALDQARRGVFGGFSALMIWATQAVLWGSYSWSPLWLRAGVLPLVVVGAVYALYRLTRRIAVIDHYEAHIPARTPATPPGA